MLSVFLQEVGFESYFRPPAVVLPMRLQIIFSLLADYGGQAVLESKNRKANRAATEHKDYFGFDLNSAERLQFHSVITNRTRYLLLLATYAFTILAGSPMRSNSSSVTKPSFCAAPFNRKY